MENDINDILATKRAWRKGDVDRRQKDGTREQRKDLADVIRRGRQMDMDKPRPWWQQIWRIIFPVVLLMVICGSAQAYTASWYGTTGDTTDPWKHVRTANGEHFNENALTAASWRYPLGTSVRVTNVATGASVVVRINDRGPGRHLYRKGRIIDLTRGAFARIAPLSAGVIHVIVREICIN